MENKKIIAVLGLPGSGKTEVINYLLKKLKCPKVYFGEVTFDEMKKQNLEINEKNERMVREGLREKHGNNYYAKQVVKKIKKIKGSQIILVESLYSWEEYLHFIECFGDDFITLAVYASPRIRYARLSKRPTRPLTEDEARSRDYAQIKNISQAGPIAMANFTVNNNTSLSDLHTQLDKIINNIYEK